MHTGSPLTTLMVALWDGCMPTGPAPGTQGCCSQARAGPRRDLSPQRRQETRFPRQAALWEEEAKIKRRGTLQGRVGLPTGAPPSCLPAFRWKTRCAMHNNLRCTSHAFSSIFCTCAIK